MVVCVWICLQNGCRVQNDRFGPLLGGAAEPRDRRQVLEKTGEWTCVSSVTSSAGAPASPPSESERWRSEPVGRYDSVIGERDGNERTRALRVQKWAGILRAQLGVAMPLVRIFSTRVVRLSPGSSAARCLWPSVVASA